MLTTYIPLALLLGASLASAEPLVPWQLRPMTTSSYVRAESAAAAFYDANGNVDIASTSAVSASYELGEHWAPMLRLGFVANNAPGAALDGTTFANPIVGVSYSQAVADGRFALFSGTTLPLGTRTGTRTALANAASMTARPADDAMFAASYMTAIVGSDVAYTAHGVTAQAEATLQQSVRVRGDNEDAYRTRAALGVHLGSYIGNHVSVAGDLLYQRWLSHPMMIDDTSALTASIGVRVHVRVGDACLHPGVSYTRGLDATGPTAGSMITNRTTAIAIDLPVSF